MGLIRQHVRLSNPHEPELEDIDAMALVDSGAAELCVPEHIAQQLKLKHAGERIVELADGSRQSADLMITVKLDVFGLSWAGQAVVVGNEVLLGALPMESLGLQIDPRGRRVFPDPASPNIPTAVVKGLQRDLR
ncbi:aspartyl protease family protein [uncultured Sphingomonas sp.]|uniref:aspartyl protease family protein n=1 Tax=uncultured Sphingomonas sp. TaxID=158754 RepID=UPI0035CA0486